MSLVSSDDDEIGMLAARHLEQVSFRSSPAGLYDGGYFLVWEKCRDTFREIALKFFLNFFYVSRQRQRPFISWPARFIRGPAAIQNGGLEFADLPQLIHPTQSSIAGRGKIVSDEDFQLMFAANPGSEPPARTYNQRRNRRRLNRTLGYAPDEQSSGEAMSNRSDDNESRF
jgi:hypothetical protein